MKKSNWQETQFDYQYPKKMIWRRVRVFKLILILATPFWVNDARANWADILGGIGAAAEGYNEGKREAERDRQGLPPSNMERATRTDEEDAGGGYKRCFYSTTRGFKFSINVKSYSCPYSVQINPETMQVLKP